MRAGNAKDMERFTDLINIAVINLKYSCHQAELGSLYTKSKTKMPESLLTQYNRWVFEHKRIDGVETLGQAGSSIPNCRQRNCIWVDNKNTVYQEENHIIG